MLDAQARWIPMGTDAATPGLHITLDLDAAALPAGEVALRWRSKYLGPDYAAQAVTLDTGQPWPTALEADAEGHVRLDYTVRLHVDLATTPFGRGGIHFPITGGWHLLGRSFLPDLFVDDAAQDVPARLRLDASDVHWASAAGLGVHEQSATSIRLADRFFTVAETLASSEVAAGRGETPVVLVSPDYDQAQLDAAALFTERAITHLEERLGPLPASQLVAAFYQVDASEPPWGSGLVDSVVQTGPPPGSPTTTASSVYVHELVHLWLPGRYVVAEDWLEEGFTDYLTVRAMADLTGASALDTARVLLRSWQAYAATIGSDAIVDAERSGRFPYDAGMVVAWCSDTHLRAATQGQIELDDVMRDLLSEAGSERLTHADLVAAVAQADPAVAQSLTGWLTQAGPIDASTCAGPAGFEVENLTWQGLTPRALAVDWLGIHGLSEHAKLTRFTVTAASDDSALQAGDEVLSVGGYGVANLADVDRALRDAEPGSPIAVVIERSGEQVQLELSVPAQDWGERAMRHYVGLRQHE